MYLLLLLLIGAAIQMKVEGWSYGDSLYFYVVTFTTVGFGDLLPQEAKYITVPFILLGLTAISNILHAAAAVALIKRVTAGSQVNDKTEKLTKKEAEVWRTKETFDKTVAVHRSLKLNVEAYNRSISTNYSKMLKGRERDN